MKSVLISIQPKWCELIVIGKKTLEVRKTKPNIATPFKCYIYETNWRNNTYWANRHKGKLGKVIGEFVCDFISPVAMFDGFVDVVDCQTSCLSVKEINEYSDGKVLYGWHISDLVIYDDPKSLGEFNHCGVNYHFDPPITRPPQSWCYAERKDGADNE